MIWPFRLQTEDVLVPRGRITPGSLLLQLNERSDCYRFAPYIPLHHTLFESLSASKRYYWAISWLNSVSVFLVLDVSSFYCLIHIHISSAPILGLCHGVFTDQFIFRHILGLFFPRKENLHHDYGRIWSIRNQKEKLNVLKRQKISFLGLKVLLTGLWNLKDIQNWR